MRKRSVGINVRVSVTENEKGDAVGSNVWVVTFRILAPAGAGI